MRRFGFLILLLALLAGNTALAQSGGQFCIRSFEDRNGNGTLDGGEPLLTRSISANLLNADSIIVASALLAESPTAAQGVICFQFLDPGDYSVVVTSGDYHPTSSSTFAATINDGALPTVIEFGGQRAPVESVAGPDAPAAGPGDDFLPRLVLALLGALLVIAGMVVLGTLIYLFGFRNRQAMRPQPATATGAMATVEAVEVSEDTDEIKPVT